MRTTCIDTSVFTVSEMLEVTDEMILDITNGEVLYPAPNDQGDPYQKSMTDPSIFGKMGDNDTLMGHIDLPIPVVNIQYLFGTMPILPRLLNMPRRDLESVVYYSSYVVTDPGDSDAVYKKIISVKDAYKFRISHPGVTLMTGAEAICFLLEKEGVKEKDYIVLHMLPVIPLSLRYRKINHKNLKKDWYPYSIEFLYERILFRKKRLIDVMNLKTPEVFSFEQKRILQECVDSLINNGAHGMPHVTLLGTPSDSLQRLYEIISKTSDDSLQPSMPLYESIDAEEIRKLLHILYTPDQYDDIDYEEDWDTFPLKKSPKEIAEEEITTLLRPFVDAVIQENFPQYMEKYYDAMYRFAEWAISNSLYSLDPKKPIEPQLLDGIVSTIRVAMKKQEKYL